VLLKVTACDLAASFKLMLCRFVIVTASSQATDRGGNLETYVYVQVC
jgi:hypothetical protein